MALPFIPCLKAGVFWHGRIKNIISPYTMTSEARRYALIDIVEQTLHVPGAFVECGVWRCGSSMIAALTYKYHNTFKDLYLFDTFQGNLSYDPIDTAYNGLTGDSDECSCVASLEDVQSNMSITQYPHEHIHYFSGLVQETIDSNFNVPISVLRLDTDWYDSTLHTLKYLYPLLQSGGVVLIDDYGFWNGCKKAVNEYFLENIEQWSPEKLQNIDNEGVYMIKE